MFYNLPSFSRRKPGLPKTKLVAVFPDGHEYTLHFKNGAWWWDYGKGSFPQSSAIQNVEEAGGFVHRKPR